MPTERKSARLAEEIARAAAQFLERESNRTALITVMGVAMTEKNTRATVRLSVLPPSGEEVALAFANRHAGAFRTFLAHTARMRRTPHISFVLDRGEKNRQRIEELSRL